MEITYIQLLVYNLILNLIIIISGVYFFVKAIEHMMVEEKQYKSEKEEVQDSSFEVLFDQLNIIRRKFWHSFYILEFSLITYFVFWGLLFFEKVKVVF